MSMYEIQLQQSPKSKSNIISDLLTPQWP